jgi:RNA polymerase sigma factor (sigma-70 family)
MPEKNTKLLVDHIAQKYYSVLKNYLHGKLKSGDEAEEITQESFLRLQRVKNLQHIENHKAYLFKTANNLVLEKYRRETKVPVQSLNQMADFDLEDPCSDLERKFGANEELQLITEAIMQLPERCRKAFILRNFYSFSYKEIARNMKISVKTVEKHLAKALLHCHTYYDQLNKNNIVIFPSKPVKRKEDRPGIKH